MRLRAGFLRRAGSRHPGIYPHAGRRALLGSARTGPQLSEAAEPGTSLGQKVTLAASWLAVAQLARRAWAILVTTVLAHLLVPEDFGLLALTLILTGALSAISDVGLTSAVIQRRQVNDEHLSTAFWMNMALAAALALTGVALAVPFARFYEQPRVAPLLMAMMMTLPLAAIGQVAGALLQRRMRFRALAGIDLASSLVSGTVAVLLAHLEAGVWALVAQYILMSAGSSIGRLIFSHWQPRVLFRARQARELLSFSAAVLGGALVNYFIINVDNALIGRALGTRALGLYVIAYNLVMLPGQVIGGLIAQVLFPALSSMQDDRERVREAYLKALRVLAMVGFPCVAGLAAIASPLINLAYGPQWAPAVPVVEVLAVVGLWQAINLSSTIFYALGRPNIVVGWAAISSLALFGGFVVGMRWGIVGVAWSYALLTPLVCLVPHVLAYRFIGLRLSRFLGSVLPFLGSALLMGGLVRWLWSALPAARLSPLADLLALIAAGAAIYAALVIAVAVVLKRSRWAEWLLGDPGDQIIGRLRRLGRPSLSSPPSSG